MKTLAVVLSVSILVLLAGCSQAEPTPDTAAVEATVAQRIFATLTASAAQLTDGSVSEGWTCRTGGSSPVSGMRSSIGSRPRLP